MSSEEAEVVEDYTGTGVKSQKMSKYILDATTAYGVQLKSVFHAHTSFDAIEKAKVWIDKHCKSEAHAKLQNEEGLVIWEIAQG